MSEDVSCWLLFMNAMIDVFLANKSLCCMFSSFAFGVACYGLVVPIIQPAYLQIHMHG